ncbi:MAG: serine hydrolase domain-containing protein [Nitrospiria bacterium]
MKSSFKQVVSLLQKALSDHYFSGASLLVFNQGQILFQQQIGYTSWKLDRLEPIPVDSDTLFDLASLTKPLATVFLYALFVQEGKISLDDTLGKFIESIQSEDKRNLTVRALLNHSSGFPDWKPYFLERFSKDARSEAWSGQRVKTLLYQNIHQEPLIYPPGEKSLYSDLGFILLGEILEYQCNEALDHLFYRKIVQPLGIKDIGFVPLNPLTGDKNPNPFGAERVFVATEKSELRGKIIQGEVHDDNAYVMGGVAGHAGLFGTVQSVYSCFSEWTKGFWNKGTILKSSTVKEFVDRDKFPADWGLGWMFPSITSSAGSFFSKKSFGHLGFTGTSIWYDPLVDLGVIFLSNRVHPTSSNHHLKEFRPALHDQIYQTVVHEKA